MSNPSHTARDERMPEQGSLLRITGLGDRSGLFRVLNEPKPDEQGTFTLEVESMGSPNGV